MLNNCFKKIEEKNNGIKKHVATIHCSNKLSLLQRKISNALLFHAYPHLKTREEHKVSIKSLCSYLEYKGRNYDAIKEALRALISTVIEWNIISENKNEEDWTASSILASVNIRNAICTYAYSPRMRDLLHFPSVYGEIDLSIQSGFKSRYGFALYENCARYRKLGRTKTFSISVFRKIMGVSDEEYLIFRDFKRRVINKAVEEVNKASDLIITPYIQKNKHEETMVYFDIEDKKEETKKNKGVLEDKLEKIYLLGNDDINRIVRKHGIKKIEEKIEQIEKTEIYLSGEIKNLAGFLIDALKKDYTPTKAKRFLVHENRSKEYMEETKLRLEEKEKDNLVQKYEKYLDKQVGVFFNDLNYESQQELKLKFEEYLAGEKDAFVLKGFRQFGLENKIARIFLRGFLKKTSLYDYSEITLEEYKKKQKCSDTEH